MSRSARLAIDECQHQFKYNRWNCSVFNKTDVYGRLSKKATKETAFIYGINSAAAMFEITRACTRGDLKKCSCNSIQNQSRLNSNHEWTGCSDNVLFGYKLSKSFVDSRELLNTRSNLDSKDAKLMNLLNNEVGRRIVLKNMQQVCKCHGVSGSCSIKVCWKILPEFRVIGDELMKNYKMASHLKETNVKERVKKLSMILSKRHSRNLSSVFKKDSLVFMRNSPNFCRSNSRNGIMGTVGRVCSVLDVADKNNSTKLSEIRATCDYLCCGRGFMIETRETEEDCDCQFQWCCSVKCKKCKKKIIEYYCN